MPAIQQYSAQISESGIPQGRAVQPADFNAGQGAAALSKGLDAVADRLNDDELKAKKIDERNQELEARKAYSDTMVDFQKEQAALREQYVGNEDIADTELALYDKFAELANEKVKGRDFATAKLQQRFQENRDNFHAQSLGYQSQIRGQKRVQDVKSIITNTQNMVIADPSQYDSAKKDMADTIKLLGGNPIQIQAAIDESTQDLAASAWAGYSDAEKLRIVKSSRQPLSVRNNNPGNIRGADGEFLKFPTQEAGYEAMRKDLEIKIGGKSGAMERNFGKGYTPSIQNLIATYAPATENDVGAYVKTVSQETGIAPDAVLTAADIPKLQKAMVKVEGGSEAANYFGKTGTAFDDLSPNNKIKAVSVVKSYQSVVVKQEIDNIQTAAKLGLMIPPERIIQVADMALEAGQEDTYKQLTDYAQVQGQSIDFANKGLVEQQAMLKIERAKAQTGDLSGVQKLEAFGDVYQYKVKMLKEDAWGYYSQRGIVSIPEKSIFENDPETIPQRRLEAEKVATLEGGSVSLPLITDSEADQLKAMYDKGRFDDLSKALVAIGSQTSGTEKKLIATKISEKDKILGAAIAIEDTTVANMLLLGNAAKGEVTAEKFKQASASKLSGVIFDGVANDSMQSTIYAYYKQLAIASGDVSKEPNGDLIDRAIEDVVGKVEYISIRGNPSRVIVPTGMTAGELEDKLYSFDDKELEKIGGAIDDFGNQRNIAQLFEQAKLETVGNGKYQFINPNTGQHILTQTGKPLIIDISKVTKKPTPNIHPPIFLSP